MRPIPALTLAGALLASLAGMAHAAPPTAAQLCEAAADGAAAKFAQCRLKAESSNAKVPDPIKLASALGKCSTKLSDAFSKALGKYGIGNCPTEPASEFDIYLTQCSDDTAVAAAGGVLPDYDGDLATCNADLSTCNADLSTCDGSLTTCNAGTALAADVLSSKTFSSIAGLGVAGTMPNNGAVTLTPTMANQAIAAGYHSGSGYCAGDADLVAGNIASGVNLFGVSGSVIAASGAAAAGDVLSGQTFSNAGGAGTGTMPNNGAVTLTPSTSDQAIAAGYHSGSGKCAGDADLVAGNIASGVNLFGVSGSVIAASGAAAAGDVLSGQTFSNASGAGTGTMPDNGAVTLTPGTSDQAIAAGYHSGSGYCAGDADLVAGNIKNGVNLFGVSGTTLPAQLLKTGQTSCWDEAGAPISCAFRTYADGNQQTGVALSYVDNGDGTITDANTGLMWEKLSDDGSIHDKDNTYTFIQSIDTRLGSLNGAGGFAGYTDWRAPNRRELESIVNLQNVNPAVSAAFNTGCVASCTVLTCSCTVSLYYWSSSTYANFPTYAWLVDFGDGYVLADGKTGSYYVRAVRGGS